MKILVAMSGGVDSSLAAALVMAQGHEAHGVYMKNWINEPGIIGHCPWQEDIEDASAVARQLGMSFEVVNLMDAYRQRVVSQLLEGYEEGITPNPDVACNREMKFGVLWDWAKPRGFEAIATGHYAQKQGEEAIWRGADPNKDQTYFLAMLRRPQARIAHFPIGHLLKPELRQQAKALGLKTAEKKDSQGICFIGEVRMEDFLRAHLPDAPGHIVDPSGRVLGQHRGLHFYTLGQRKGIGVASPFHRQAYVVVAKRQTSRELVIDIERPDTPLLWARRCSLSHLNDLTGTLDHEQQVLVQPRYRCPAAPARLIPTTEGCADLIFEQPQRALTPGQVAAIYQDQQLFGGAIFQSILHD